ncbi:hypothetical protein [Gluconacetobacter diazotrophicus]|uniref:hypothetical protein n=1 Tax=Gluconacetobacter diazotrophicus TaxID=33996 RepID=UPI00119AD358|nr:hypothetical protein [Gluconacetobacter diazotrophicus]TWB00388.1 hypothetical protein FBZ86_1372 [Gluconacetobacter diazotrophicus]
MTSLRLGFRVVYGKPKYSRPSDAWVRCAKCAHTAPELEPMRAGGDQRVQFFMVGDMQYLAISPGLAEAR